MPGPSAKSRPASISAPSCASGTPVTVKPMPVEAKASAASGVTSSKASATQQMHAARRPCHASARPCRPSSPPGTRQEARQNRLRTLVWCAGDRPQYWRLRALVPHRWTCGLALRSRRCAGRGAAHGARLRQQRDSRADKPRPTSRGLDHLGPICQIGPLARGRFACHHGFTNGLRG